MNLDPIYGLPSHMPDFGQGDTGHDTFTILYCCQFTGQLPPVDATKALWALTSPDNWPRRSPDTALWYGKPNRCSRDLLTPYLAFVASRASVAPTRYKRLMHAMALHGFLFADNSKPNYRYDTLEEHLKRATPDVPFEPQKQLRDFLGPDIWSMCLRGSLVHSPGLGKLLVAYPLLMVLDLQGLLNAILSLCQRSNMNQRNAALKQHFAYWHYPTLLSVASYWLYRLSKPTKAFKAYWGQPGEPAVDVYMCELFSRQW